MYPLSGLFSDINDLELWISPEDAMEHYISNILAGIIDAASMDVHGTTNSIIGNLILHN